MGSRSTGRRLAMQAIFQAELSKTDVESALKYLYEEEELSDEAMSFSSRIAKGVERSRKEIDSLLETCSKNWPVDRMDLVDKSISKVAIYEMMHEKSTPRSVVINEAVELAKKYSGDDSSSFINGVLDKIVV